MKQYSSKEIIKILKSNGWIEKGKQIGSHLFFVNPNRPELGKVTVPHPRSSFPKSTVKSIARQTEIEF